MTEAFLDIPGEDGREYRQTNSARALKSLGLAAGYFGEEPLNYQEAVGLHDLDQFFRGRSSMQDRWRYRFFERSEPALLRELLAGFPATTNALWFLVVYGVGILNRGVLEVAIDDDHQALNQVQKSLWAHNFEPTNPLHLALEFTRGQEQGWYQNYADFASLPVEGEIVLNAEQEADIEAMAEDNLKFLAWLRAEVLKGPCVVIFNQRYGSYYVGDVLKHRIKGLKNLTMATEYVGSTGYDVKKTTLARWDKAMVNRETRDLFADTDTHPHIIVVDGSSSNQTYLGTDQEEVPRLPRAMRAFELLAKENERSMQVWVPGKGVAAKAIIGNPKSEFSLRHSVVESNVVADEAKLTFVSITTGESKGKFDNPEVTAQKKIVCLGKRGVVKAPTAPNEEALVEHVQRQIKQRMKASLS